jgi:succinate dehydrogenase/fumarate reductase-like Fe-S protein
MKSPQAALCARYADPNRPTGRAQCPKDHDNIGYCNITKCCTKVCPEHIHITDNAIIPLKERVVDRFYDPVSGLLRMVTG